jgi:hypothetical protein
MAADVCLLRIVLFLNREKLCEEEMDSFAGIAGDGFRVVCPVVDV